MPVAGHAQDESAGLDICRVTVLPFSHIIGSRRRRVLTVRWNGRYPKLIVVILGEMYARSGRMYLGRRFNAGAYPALKPCHYYCVPGEALLRRRSDEE